MDINKQPGINFKGIILAEERFWRLPNAPIDSSVNVQFEFSAQKNETNGNYYAELKTILKMLHERNEVLSLECTFVGIFSYIKREENINMDDFIKYNCPALMLPYVREHISSVTLKAGMKPVLLAPINIIALLNKKKEEEHE